MLERPAVKKEEDGILGETRVVKEKGECPMYRGTTEKRKTDLQRGAIETGKFGTWRSDAKGGTDGRPTWGKKV